MQCKVGILRNRSVQLQYILGNKIIISLVNGPVRMCNKCSQTVEWKMMQIISGIMIPH